MLWCARSRSNVTDAEDWMDPLAGVLRAARESAATDSQSEVIRGHLMLRERVAPHSEVIRPILLEDSPCCWVPQPEPSRRASGSSFEWLWPPQPQLMRDMITELNKGGGRPQPSHRGVHLASQLTRRCLPSRGPHSGSQL